jgi:hypothetical protein
MTVADLQVTLSKYLESGQIKADSEIVIVGVDRQNLLQKANKLLRLAAAGQENVYATFDAIGSVVSAIPDQEGRIALICTTTTGSS